MVDNVYRVVFVNARLDTVGQHVANVSDYENIFRDTLELASILDKGYNLVGSLACQNNGSFLSTGSCECKQGFLDATCSERE